MSHTANYLALLLAYLQQRFQTHCCKHNFMLNLETMRLQLNVHHDYGGYWAKFDCTDEFLNRPLEAIGDEIADLHNDSTRAFAAKKTVEEVLMSETPACDTSFALRQAIRVMDKTGNDISGVISEVKAGHLVGENGYQISINELQKLLLDGSVTVANKIG